VKNQEVEAEHEGVPAGRPARSEGALNSMGLAPGESEQVVESCWQNNTRPERGSVISGSHGLQLFAAPPR
jgi:hypothetical protein